METIIRIEKLNVGVRLISLKLISNEELVGQGAIINSDGTERPFAMVIHTEKGWKGMAYIGNQAVSILPTLGDPLADVMVEAFDDFLGKSPWGIGQGPYSSWETE